jgi:hypothetical protein
MTRFDWMLVIGLLLAAVLSLLGRWLWRQRGRPATTRRRALNVSVFLGWLCVLTMLVGGAQLMWHERRSQPATVADLRIIERADALLKDETAWNRNDDKQCDDDKATGKWSLYCALEIACVEALGVCEHTEVSAQEVRFAIEEVTPGKHYEGRLMGFNNLPETRFEDIKRVLKIAKEHVQARQAQPQR